MDAWERGEEEWPWPVQGWWRGGVMPEQRPARHRDGTGFTFSFFLRIPPITGNRIPDEIPPKTAFSERKMNSNLKNGIPEIPGEIPLLSGGIPLLSGGISDFLVENVIF